MNIPCRVWVRKQFKDFWFFLKSACNNPVGMSIFYILVVLTAISELFLLSERDNSINVIKENQREMSYMVTEYNNRIHEITENNIELQEENHVMAEIL